MAVTAATATFLGAIRPVGEIIPISFIDDVATPILAGAHRQINYDFEIDQNYILSGLQVTKTVGGVLADVVETISVFKYPNGTDDDNDLVEIAHVGFAASSGAGTTLIAGVLAASSGAVAAGVVPPTVASTGLYAGAGGVTTDPTIKVLSNVATSGSSPSSQKIRVQINGYNGAVVSQSPDLSVFILCELIRFTDVKLAGSEELTTVIA